MQQCELARSTHMPLLLEPSHFPPHPTHLGCHRVPDLSCLHHTANSHGLSILHTAMYMFAILYRGGDQKHSQEEEMQKGKWLFEKALQIAEKRREAKGKGEKERYNHLDAEFQRIARRYKKAFFSNQCKEI